MLFNYEVKYVNNNGEVEVIIVEIFGITHRVQTCNGLELNLHLMLKLDGMLIQYTRLTKSDAK